MSYLKKRWERKTPFQKIISKCIYGTMILMLLLGILECTTLFNRTILSLIIVLLFSVIEFLLAAANMKISKTAAIVDIIAGLFILGLDIFGIVWFFVL